MISLANLCSKNLKMNFLKIWKYGSRKLPETLLSELTIWGILKIDTIPMVFRNCQLMFKNWISLYFQSDLFVFP